MSDVGSAPPPAGLGVTNAEALHQRAQLELRAGRLEQGVALLRSSLALDSTQAGVWLNLGRAQLRLGRAEEAVQCLESSLRLNPGFPLSWLEHARACVATHHLDRALRSYERALSDQPSLLVAQLECGNLLMQLRRWQAARDRYQQVLQLDPAHGEARANLGVALLELGAPLQALGYFDQLIEQQPALAETHNNRGNALRALGRPFDALMAFDRAVELQPQLLAAWNNRALVLRDEDRLEEALASADRALMINSRYVPALNTRGDVLRALRRYEAAIACYDAALALQPDFTEAYINRACAWIELRSPTAALADLDAALKLEPGSCEALTNRGNALMALRQEEAALACYARALTFQPGHVDTLRNQGVALRRTRQLPQAQECFALIERLKPGYYYAQGLEFECARQLCDWRNHAAKLNAIEQAVLAGKAAATPFGFLSMSDSAALQKNCGATYARHEVATEAQAQELSSYGHERIRVAYVSGDFRDHVASYLMAGVFERHDRQQFEIFGVSLRPAEDSPLGRRVVAAFDHWLDVSDLSDAQTSQKLRELQIDIAVDLMGFTEDARPGIFARRVAPAQINYIGFPGTMGVPFMDYILADEFTIPSERRADYAEQVIYLPECFQANDEHRRMDATPIRIELGLPEDGLVFACFNNSYKLTPDLFGLWCDLLRAHPRSVLWLAIDHPVTLANLRRECEQRGIDSHRLISAPRLPYAQHLARIAAADLCLDTWPFNGGASASDVLWAGAPLLTCTGGAFASRMAGSLLHSLRLDELICRDLAEYAERAHALAADPARLRALRERLATARTHTPTFNTTRFCRHLEDAYQQIGLRIAHGEAPAVLHVPARPIERNDG